jgi:hypothetical protein
MGMASIKRLLQTAGLRSGDNCNVSQKFMNKNKKTMLHQTI